MSEEEKNNRRNGFPILELEEHLFRENEGAYCGMSILEGMCSPRHFRQKLEQELKRSERYCEYLSLIIVDISGLSSIISSYSSSARSSSARLLFALAALIKGEIRETDIISPLGSGKLALILTETPKEGAFCLMERLRGRMRWFLTRSTGRPTSEESLNLKVISFPDNGNDKRTVIKFVNSFLLSD